MAKRRHRKHSSHGCRDGKGRLRKGCTIKHGRTVRVHK
jgi:hypothetical protein